MEENLLVTLETDEVESQEESHAIASLGILSQTTIRWEQEDFMFLDWKLSNM